MVTMNSYDKYDRQYDSWARIYNEYWGLKYCQRNLPPFEVLLQKYHIYQGANILDLCCGTGQIAQQLIEQGYKVTGIDISEPMLQYARENAPNAKFIHDDARLFNLPPTFDAIISASASLNHIMSIEELQQVFMRSHNALLANGIFMFEINLEDAYKSWDGSIADGDVKDDFAWACCYSHNQEEKTGEFKITIFELLGQYWQRLDIHNVARAYSQAEVVFALKKVGFTDINVYDLEGNIVDSQYNNYAIFSGRKQFK